MSKYNKLYFTTTEQMPHGIQLCFSDDGPGVDPVAKKDYWILSFEKKKVVTNHSEDWDWA